MMRYEIEMADDERGDGKAKSSCHLIGSKHEPHSSRASRAVKIPGAADAACIEQRESGKIPRVDR